MHLDFFQVLFRELGFQLMNSNLLIITSASVQSKDKSSLLTFAIIIILIQYSLKIKHLVQML